MTQPAKQRALPERLLDENGRLLIEVPCLSCGYALKSLMLAARCPECGGLVTDSINANMLRFAPTRWLEQLVSGATWLIVSFAALVGAVALGAAVAGVLVIFAEQFRLTPRLEAVVTAVTSVFTVSVVFGLRGVAYWLLTTPEPGVAEPDRVRALARAGLMGGLGFSVLFQLSYQLSAPAVLLSVVQLAAVILTSFGLAGLFQHASRIFERMPRPRLAKQTLWVMWGLVPSYAVFVATNDAGRVGNTFGLDLGGWGVVIIVLAAFAIAPLIACGGWALVLLFKFRRLVADGAQASSQLAPPDKASRIATLTGRA